MAVQWKYINDYENIYKVSDSGRVVNVISGHELKGRSHKGYLRVILCDKKCRKDYFVHRLVVEAFIDNADNKSCINHKNGIKIDNRVENLEWCTYKENNLHSYRILGRKSNKGKEYNKGLHVGNKFSQGERNGRAKLNEGQVRDIRISNLPNKELAELYMVSYFIIWAIRANKIWRCVN